MMIEVSPTIGRDDKEHMNLWYATIARAEADLCRLQVDHALAACTRLNETIVEARQTLARCLSTDAEVREVRRAVEAVRAKVTRKELAARNERFGKDTVSTRERVNRRLGLPKDPIVNRPSEQSFRPRARPNQGRAPKGQRPPPGDAKAQRPPREQRPAQREERNPRPRPQQPATRPKAPVVTPDSTLAYLLKEVKKLKMRK